MKKRHFLWWMVTTMTSLVCLVFVLYFVNWEGTTGDSDHNAFKHHGRLNDLYHIDWDPYIEMTHYHDQEQLEAKLKHLEVSFPELVQLKLLGESVQGRKIYAVRITDHPEEKLELGEPSVKYVANMHGNEVVGRELMLTFMQYLCEAYYSNDTVRRFVNSHDIWIIPTMNPDGFSISQEGKCCGIQGRNNHHDKDLNRDFLLFGKEGITDKFYDDFQPETKLLADLITSRQFVLSINFHGGSLVANYPYDYPYSQLPSNQHGAPAMYAESPDDAVFKKLSLVYSQNHPEMKFGKPKQNPKCGSTDKFPEGITNGAHWYPVMGGMQDYNYFKSNSFELTVELGYCKYPEAIKLQPFWDANKNSLIEFFRQSSMGIQGSILDATSGSGIGGASIHVDGIDHDIVSLKDGSFWRLLVPGTYYVNISAEGYHPSDQTKVRVTNAPASAKLGVFQNLYLYPDSSRHESQLSQRVIKVQQPSTYRASLDPDKFIKDIHKKYPTVTDIYSIGQSTNGHPMKVLVISDNPKKHELGEPEMKLISTLHGNELVGLELLATFTEYLLENYGVNEELTWLVDNTRIHILLAANPDGRHKLLKATGGKLDTAKVSIVESNGRGNGHGQDLNRNFLFDGSQASLEKCQLETQNMIKWTQEHQFLLSLVYHGGSKVVCYPYDDTYTPVPDIEVFRYISSQYVKTNEGMRGGYPCPKEWPKERFPGGHLAGAKWYPFKGGSQDVHYNFSNTFEITIEVSCQKVPSAEMLPDHWEENRESLVSFVKMAHVGVSGFVTSSEDDSPVPNCVISVQEIGHNITCTNRGEYWRLLVPGSYYTITASAPGFIPQTKYEYVPTEQEHNEVDVKFRGTRSRRLNFVLRPAPSVDHSKSSFLGRMLLPRNGNWELPYLGYEDYRAVLGYLQTSYPELTSVKYLGSSSDDSEVNVISITAVEDVTQVPHFAIFGGMSEREHISTATLLQLAVDLCSNYSKQTSDAETDDENQLWRLLDSAVFHIVPSFFPSKLTTVASAIHGSSSQQNPPIKCSPVGDEGHNMLNQLVHPESKLKEMRILNNWIEQHPISFVLSLSSGFKGALQPKTSSGGDVISLKNEEDEEIYATGRCKKQSLLSSYDMTESLREKFNIHNVLVGMDCCVDKREQSNDWSDFMFYDQFVDSTYTLVSQVLQKCLVLKVKLPKSQPVSRITVSGPVNFTSTTSDLGLFYALLDRKNIAEYGSDDDDKNGHSVTVSGNFVKGGSWNRTIDLKQLFKDYDYGNKESVNSGDSYWLIQIDPLSKKVTVSMDPSPDSSLEEDIRNVLQPGGRPLVLLTFLMCISLICLLCSCMWLALRFFHIPLASKCPPDCRPLSGLFFRSNLVNNQVNHGPPQPQLRKTQQNNDNSAYRFSASSKSQMSTMAQDQNSGGSFIAIDSSSSEDEFALAGAGRDNDIKSANRLLKL